MSEYSDYIHDFPRRCRELLNRFHEPSKIIEREVTLMLSVATTGFVIPFERLKVDEQRNPNHPLADPRRQGGAMAHLLQMMDEPFLRSRLAVGSEDDWKFFVRQVSTNDLPEVWEEMRSAESRMHREKKCGTVLKVIRNALAHGNIFTTGFAIRELVFLSSVGEQSGKFKILVVSPRSFHRFLLNWFDFLEDVPLPRGLHNAMQRL